VGTGQIGVQRAEIAPRRGEQALERAAQRGIGRFAQKFLKMSNILLADESLDAPPRKKLRFEAAARSPPHAPFCPV